MKKKVWDITVKDNPNRVVMGENDEFYTTDTEAYLVFNLEDKNFNPPSAVLTLENRNDGSLKDETVDVIDGLIEWEMPQRYIEHFGNWQGQLVYYDPKEGVPEDAPEEDKFETYTSATFTFVVNAHIGDKKKPSLVEIENWEKFIRDGTELIETWEDLEALREENERQRQENYQELLDTGVLQTNINNKLEQLEEEYAPKLTEVTTQLAQKANQLDVFLRSKGININDFDEPTRQAFLELNGIDVNYVLGRANVRKENVAEKEIYEGHLSFLSNRFNLFNGIYVNNILISGTAFRDNNPNARTAVIKVEPNTTYTIRKSPSNMLRVATNKAYPEIGGVINREITNEYNVGGKVSSTCTFTTNSEEHYVVITVSTNAEEPTLTLVEGKSPDTVGDSKVVFTKEVEAPNIKVGKNLFNGNYLRGRVHGAVGAGSITEEDGSLAIVSVKPNTSYTISKTISNRFRIATSTLYPYPTGSVTRLTPDSLDNDLEVTITTGEHDYFLIVYVSNGIDGEPSFMQVEESASATSWETYGYKLEPQAKDYGSIGYLRERVLDGKVYVDSFGGGDKSDTETIQDALDYANGNIVVFNPERKYEVNATVIANAAQVRGIEGQNALIEIKDNDVDVLRFQGSKSGGGATPSREQNRLLSLTEMNPFINNLRVSSNGDQYIGNGIVVIGTFGLKIMGSHAFNLKHGFKVVGNNRNIIMANNNIWNISENGIFWDNADIHQQNLTGNHISYCKKAIYVENSDMHNLQIVGNDIEGGASPINPESDSIIHFHLDADKIFNYEAIHIVGNSLQDHGMNTFPLLMFNSEKEGGFQDLIIGNNQLANSRKDSFYVKGADRATFSGNTIKGNTSPQSINLEGVNKNISITGNHLRKGIKWSEETTQTVITGNVADGFDLPDSNDGKVLVANNI